MPGTQELIIAGVVIAVLLVSPLLFAFARAGFRHPLLKAIPVSIAVFLVVILFAGFTGGNALAILAIIAIAGVVYGFSRSVITSSDKKCEETLTKASSTRSKHIETQNVLSSEEVEKLTGKIAFMKGNRELIENRIVEYMTAHPDKSPDDVVDFVTEKCFLEHQIKVLEAEIEGENARYGEQLDSLKPLGNLTYEEAGRYFNEYCEILIRGCGIREKVSILPTSFDRMKEALKVECLNWTNLGGDFDENWELIGTAVIKLSCFVPDELAEKTRKFPGTSNIEAMKAYFVASRAADEIIERRTNELNVEWNEFRKKYRTEQIANSPSVANGERPQRHAPAVVSKSERNEATSDPVNPSAPDALGTPQNETDGHDAKPVSFQPESEASDAELNKRPSDSYKASTKRSETYGLSVLFVIVVFLILLGIFLEWYSKSTQTGKLPFDSSDTGSVEQESRNDTKNAQKSDFLEKSRKAEMEATKHFPPEDPSADGLDRQTGNAITARSGRPGEIEKFLRYSIDQMVAQRNQYQAELDNIGWDRILDPERLAADPRLARSKVAIRQAKEIVDKYTEQMSVLLAKMRNDINALSLSAGEKAEAREAFEKGTQESSQTRNLIWQLEREIVWKCGEMIDYLYMDYGNWSVSDSQIIFSSNEKAAAYNRYLEAIEKLVAQQEQLRRYGVQKVQAGTGRLEVPR